MRRPKDFVRSAVLAAALLAGGLLWGGEVSGMDNGRLVFEELPLSSVSIRGGFWGARQDLIEKTTLPSQWEQLEAHHHLDNFRVAAGKKPGMHLGPVYLDSDLYKWLEAASYVIGRHPEDAVLSGRVEEVVGLIRDARMPDGYINTYYQCFAPDRRFTNLLMNHELYCAGHLMEAACAHFRATGDPALLEAATGFADMIGSVFGPGMNEGVPGHEEIEPALIKLYRVTGEKRYLDLAGFFVNQRGRNPGYVRELFAALRDQSALSKIADRKRAPFISAGDREAKSSYGFGFIDPAVIPRSLACFYSGRYFQMQAPVSAQRVAEGHAVRAMYLYSGAADLVMEGVQDDLKSALLEIWKNTISKRTYITGGMGSLAVTEGFGREYELPNDSYTETCAAVGSILFSWRMLQITGEARYADQIERTLYNGFLSGLSLDGAHYFYRNPLCAHGDRERQPWYVTACCPPNIARLISSLDRYLYGAGDDGIWIHQYVSGRAEFEAGGGGVAVEVTSDLPWEGRVLVRLFPEGPLRFALHLRAPAWADEIKVTMDGEPLDQEIVAGEYFSIESEWRPGDEVELTFSMTPRLVDSPPEVKPNQGKVAIMRGPLVYCLEDVDNPGLDVHKLELARDPALYSDYWPDRLGGLVVVKGRTSGGAEFTAIPYYAWANRGRSHMEVWVRAEQ